MRMTIPQRLEQVLLGDTLALPRCVGRPRHAARWSLCVVVAAALALGACVSPPEPGEQPMTSEVSDWRDEVIYQVFTDRFFDGDPSNNYNVNLRDPASYHGGDWQGLIDRLGYLEELGVTALWISPVVKNVEQDAGFSSYHGYWTQDFTRTNPHFGDMASLRELTDEAHARGMKVILDVVTNHVGQAFYYDINQNGQPDEFYIGQGGRIIPLDQGEGTSDLVRISEYDPDFDINGIQSWTSLGPAGEAPIRFVNEPALNRVTPFPDIFSLPQAYNRKGRVTVWTDPEVCSCPGGYCAWDDPCRRAQETLGDFPGGLKDLATTQQPVRDALFEIFARWVEIGNFDGFRIDTLKHVEQGFWEDFCPRMRAFTADRGKDNFLMFGEAFDGDDALLGYYTQGQGVDSVFYFSQYYVFYRNLLLGDGARTCELERLHCRRFGCDADPCGEGAAIGALYNGDGKNAGPADEAGTPLNSRQLVINFASNHDVGRLLFFMPPDWDEARRRQVLHLGLTYLMTIDGIPSLYYGVEQEFAGGNDPSNRETLWADKPYQREDLVDGRFTRVFKRYDKDGDGVAETQWRPFDTGNPTFTLLKELIALRKANVALRRGDLRIAWSTNGGDGDDHGIFAFERQHPEQTALVVMNLALDQASQTRLGDATMRVNFAPGTTLVDQLDPRNRWVVTADGCDPAPGEGCVEVTAAPKTAQVLIAE